MKTLLAAFHSVEECSQTVSDVIAAGIVPAALEFVDAKTIEAVEASVYKAGYPLDAVAALLIEVDGFRDGLEETSDCDRGDLPAESRPTKFALPKTMKNAPSCGSAAKAHLARWAVWLRT